MKRSASLPSMHASLELNDAERERTAEGKMCSTALRWSEECYEKDADCQSERSTCDASDRGRAWSCDEPACEESSEATASDVESPPVQAPMLPPGAWSAAAAGDVLPPGVWQAQKSKVVKNRKGTMRVAAAEEPEGKQWAPAEMTTLIVRDLPVDMTRRGFQEFVNSEGFEGQYDFVYLPINFKTGRTFRYGLLNLTSSQTAHEVFQRLTTRSDGIYAEWSRNMQGLESLLTRYRSSPLMESSHGEDSRPLLLENGQPVPF